MKILKHLALEYTCYKLWNRILSAEVFLTRSTELVISQKLKSQHVMNLQVIKNRNYELNANSEKFKKHFYGALQ